MRLPPTPCRVCFRPRVFNNFSHFWQKKLMIPVWSYYIHVCELIYRVSPSSGSSSSTREAFRDLPPPPGRRCSAASAEPSLLPPPSSRPL